MFGRLVLILFVGTCRATCVSEGFEGGAHAWQTWGTGRTSWQLGSGRTPSYYTGPNSADHGSFYYYIEASGGSNNDVAYLKSPTTTLPMSELNFYFHMYGWKIGELEIYALGSTDPWTAGERVWGVTGYQHSSEASDFTYVSVRLAGMSFDVHAVVFHATRGTGRYAYLGDMAVDNFHIQCGAAPPSPPGPPPSAPMACDNTCPTYPYYANDNYCDDGGEGSQYSLCEYGTDCNDCEPRVYSPSMPPSAPVIKCDLLMDLVLIIDKSGSMSPYTADLEAFQLSVVRQFVIGPGSTAMGGDRFLLRRINRHRPVHGRDGRHDRHPELTCTQRVDAHLCWAEPGPPAHPKQRALCCKGRHDPAHRRRAERPVRRQKGRRRDRGRRASKRRALHDRLWWRALRYGLGDGELA